MRCHNFLWIFRAEWVIKEVGSEWKTKWIDLYFAWQCHKSLTHSTSSNKVVENCYKIMAIRMWQLTHSSLVTPWDVFRISSTCIPWSDSSYRSCLTKVYFILLMYDPRRNMFPCAKTKSMQFALFILTF